MHDQIKQLKDKIIHCRPDQRLLLSFTSDLQMCPEPEEFFSTSASYPKICLSSPAGDTRYYALALQSLPEYDSLGAVADVPFFHGCPFYADEQNPAGCWQNFGGEFFACPAVLLISCGKGRVRIIINLVNSGSAAKFNQTRELILQELDRLSQCNISPDHQDSPDLTAQFKLIDEHPDFEHYQKIFDQVSEDIRSRRLEKIVLGRSCHFSHHLKPADLLHRYLAHYSSGYVYFIQTDPASCFAGNTPECLCSVEDEQIQTMALAGTIDALKDGADETLLHSHKNQHENSYVAQWIRRQMNKWCDWVSVSDLQIVRAGSLYHLNRSIEGTLREDISIPKIARALHPTPAMAGCPQKEALARLRALEDFQRGWYAGFLGLQMSRKAQYCVLIRGILLQGDEGYIHVGSGIIDASKLEEEWQELNQKQTAVLQSINAQLH